MCPRLVSLGMTSVLGFSLIKCQGSIPESLIFQAIVHDVRETATFSFQWLDFQLSLYMSPLIPTLSHYIGKPRWQESNPHSFLSLI